MNFEEFKLTEIEKEQIKERKRAIEELVDECIVDIGFEKTMGLIADIILKTTDEEQEKRNEKCNTNRLILSRIS